MEQEFVNNFPLVGSAVDLDGWTRFPARGPTVLIVSDRTLSGLFYWNPLKPPTTTDADSAHPVGADSVIFLPRAGVYFLKYSGSGRVVLRVHDVSGFSNVGAFFSTCGFIQWTSTRIVVATTTTSLLAANERRVYASFEYHSGTTDTACNFNINSTGLFGFKVRGGNNLPGNFKEFYGGKLCKGAVTGIALSGSSTQIVVSEGTV